MLHDVGNTSRGGSLCVSRGTRQCGFLSIIENLYGLCTFSYKSSTTRESPPDHPHTLLGRSDSEKVCVSM